MNEEKFIQALRESMKQERDIDFSLASWQDLEERLGKEKRIIEWNRLWWILPFLFGASIIFWQWKHLQHAQEQINELKEQKVVPQTKQDTVFEKVIIYEYDTIRRTIIEQPSSSTLFTPPKSVDEKIENQQLEISISQSSSGVQSTEFFKRQEEMKTLSNNTFENYPSLNSLLLPNRDIEPYYVSWKMLQREKKRFNLDWLAIELAFDFDKNVSDHWNFQKDIQLTRIGDMMVRPPNVDFPISLPVLPKQFFPDKWRRAGNSFLLQLGLDYEFQGERWQPFFGLSLAGDWDEHLFSQATYVLSPNITSINPPALPLELRRGQPLRNSIPIETEINLNHKTTSSQIMSYRQAIRMWYELNVGMKYNF